MRFVYPSYTFIDAQAITFAAQQPEKYVEFLLLGNYSIDQAQSLSPENLTSFTQIKISSSNGTTRLVTLSGMFRVETQMAVCLHIFHPFNITARYNHIY